MVNPIVYTVGQGNRRINELIMALTERGVRYFCDVRTTPISKHAPEFCKVELGAELSLHGITYVSFGATLGGRPQDISVYREDGYVDYDLLLASPDFISGIDRIVRGIFAGYTLAIFCSEGKPERCHRSKAVGRALSERGVRVVHVDSDGTEIDQDQVLKRLEPPPALLDLAHDPRLTSRRSYR